MISGKVNTFREAIIQLIVRSVDGQGQTIEAIIDTGFNGSLSLPSILISRFGFPFRRRGRALLADGSESIFDIHEGTVVWDGTLRRVAIDSADTEPLVGMSLLYGFQLDIRVIENGTVTITDLD